jgi:glycosyltransferase involved in cell wall biosynthesis
MSMGSEHRTTGPSVLPIGDAGWEVMLADAPARRLKMLLVPSIAWLPNWQAFAQGHMPDPRGVCKILERDHGIDVTLIDPGDFPINPLAGRHQVFAGLDPARALSILARHRDADVVLACFEPGAAALLALRRFARFRAKIAIIDIGLNEDWAIRRRLLDFVVPRVDAIYPLGRNQVDYIHRRWRTQADVRRIYQHVDAEFYRPGAQGDGTAVLSVGDDHGRDFATLLSAFADLPADLLLRSRSVGSGVGLPNVRVLRERLTPTAYRDLLQRACVVVVPLRDMLTASGVGTVLESMAMGKPLIVSDSAGIRDYVVPGETALVVPCGDAAALRIAIRQLLEQPHTRARLGAAAREFVLTHCTYRAHASALAEALRDLVMR